LSAIRPGNAAESTAETASAAIQPTSPLSVCTSTMNTVTVTPEDLSNVYRTLATVSIIVPSSNSVIGTQSEKWRLYSVSALFVK